MTLGIGLYAPCMILVSLLGMSPLAAFPIMMGSCAFLMPVGSLQFLRRGSYDLRAALGLTLGGVPAVLVAFYLVESLPLTALRWLVIGVVVYTATAMLRSALADRRARVAVGAVALLLVLGGSHAEAGDDQALPARVRRIVLHVLGGPAYREPQWRFAFFEPQPTQGRWKRRFGAHWIVWTDGSIWPRHPADGESTFWLPNPDRP